MDFIIVKRQVIKEYLNIYGDIRKDDTWSLENCISVFEYFYDLYEGTFGVEHPHISNKTVRDIIEKFPFLSSECNGVYDLTPEDYPVMIESYFTQAFQNCNYSISHFMSGEIRSLRYYETLY